MDQNANHEDLNSILLNAPGHPLIWNRFLIELSRQLNCESSALLVNDLVDNKNTHFLFSANIPEKYQSLYENTLNRLDDFNHFISKNPCRVFCNQTLNETSAEERNTAFILPDTQNYRFGLAIPCNRNHSLSLLAYRKEAFTNEEQQNATRILESLISALDEAIHTEQRYKIKSQLFHHIGNHYDSYIIVDDKLNILCSDPVFTSIISQMDCVEISDNRFRMKSKDLEQRLLSLIENKQGDNGIQDHYHFCQISLIPISSLKNLYQWECYKDAFILVFTHDKARDPVVDRLTEIYNLSKCEAVCALHFMRKPSIPDIATNTYRSQETVRNHLKHTMQKMDVHNQAELMKKLITLAEL